MDSAVPLRCCEIGQFPCHGNALPTGLDRVHDYSDLLCHILMAHDALRAHKAIGFPEIRNTGVSGCVRHNVGRQHVLNHVRIQLHMLDRAVSYNPTAVFKK